MNRAATLLCCLLLGACSSNEAPPPAPQPDAATRLELSTGAVEGFVDERGAHVWLGLPYARPPVGPLRWRAPLPPRPALGVRDATRFGAACPQIGSPLGGAPQDSYGELWGSEDCLFLNVYAPARPRAGLPVLLWIHGGGNSAGHSGFYDGTPLVAAHDVLVVTVNYRLGPIGWLHHPALAGDSPDDASGNYGTLDLVRALEWVREEIGAFGGDPDRVTVFGESAGASNIVSLLVSPRAEGLFRAAILQSGGTGSVSLAEASHRVDVPEPGDPSSSGELLLRALRREEPACDRACAVARADALSLDEQAAVFRSLSLPDLFRLFEGRSGILGPDSPAVFRDGVVLPDRPFIEALGTPGAFHPVPVLLGTNRDEPKIFQAFDPRRVTRLAGLPLWAKDARLYDLRAEYGALAWRVRGVDDIARRLHGAGVPVWSYRWDWDEEGRLLFVDLSRLLGAAHGLEIPFVFGHFDVGPQSPLLFDDRNAEGRLALSERMMAYWVAFARDLDPGTGADGLGPRWAPVDPAAGASFVTLDTGAGGIHMESEVVTFEDFVERLATDPRFDNSAERCDVFRSAVRFDGRPEQADAVDRLGCSAQ
ncbi:MAG: carboxylesterase family protein [Pseudomonadales bacterium]|jgi:para-nitrobenzyl esterase|nr:carboxylesterase family protein [Pseudomonadales bacterium]